jgi:hypothetical protein
VSGSDEESVGEWHHGREDGSDIYIYIYIYIYRQRERERERERGE